MQLKNLNFILGTSVLFFNLGLSAAEISFEDALGKAQQQNPDLRYAEERLKEANASYFKAWSELAPKIDGLASATRQKDGSVIPGAKFGGDPYNRYAAELRGTQPLFVRGTFAGLFSQTQEKKIRAIDLKIAERDLTADVIAAFYKVILFRLKYETLLKNEKIQKESLQTGEKRQQIGRGQLLDVLQMKTQLALIRPKIEKASNDLKAANADLGRILGLSDASQLNVVGELKTPLLIEIKKEIESMSFEILELRKQDLLKEQADELAAVAMADHWPRLYGAGSIGRNANKKSDISNDSATSWSVGLELTVPLFSGLSVLWDRNASNARLAQVANTEAALKNQIAASQVTAKTNLESGEVVIESSKLAYDLAEATVKEAKKNFKLATIDFLQLLQAEQNLLDAELQYDQAKYDYINLLAKYLSVYGYSLDVLTSRL